MDDDDTDSVVCAVWFEEGFERDLGPPTAATLVDDVEPYTMGKWSRYLSTVLVFRIDFES